MPSPPIWQQRLPATVRLRLDSIEAAAREARIDTHADQALDLVRILVPRMPFDDAVERYIEIMRLGGDEAELVHNRALRLLSDRGVDDELVRERPRGWGFNWRYLTPKGAFRYFERQRQRSSEEEMWMELSAARAEEALLRTHMKYALEFVHALRDHGDPTDAVEMYADRIEEPELRSRAIYQRTLAEIAELYLTRLRDEDDEGFEEEEEESGWEARRRRR